MTPLDRGRRDRGSAAVEVLGAVPIAVIVIICLVQACFFAYTVLATGQAARDGARAVSLGDPAGVAVDRSLPGALSASSVGVSGERVSVAVKMPEAFPMPNITVRRSATMPETGS